MDRGFWPAQGLQLCEHFLQPARAVWRRDKFEGEARWLVMIDTGIIARQMFKQPYPDVVGLTEVYPEGTIEPVDPRCFWRIEQDEFVLKSILAVTIFGERLGSCGRHSTICAICFVFWTCEPAFHGITSF
jgi:hypothetical protein